MPRASVSPSSRGSTPSSSPTMTRVGALTRPRLGRVSAPTLVIVGDEDGVLPRDEGETLARGIPGATLHEMARAGHLLPLERPEALGFLLDEWLGTVDGLAG